MICSSAMFSFLLLTVVASSGDEFEEPENSRYLPSERVTSVYSSLAPTNSYFQQKLFKKYEDNRRNLPDTYAKQVNDTLVSSKNEILTQKAFKTDLKFLFKEVKICWDTHSSMSNEEFKQKLYCFLLNKISGMAKTNPEDDFSCNITKKAIAQLKSKQHLTEIFKKIFILNPKNYSCQTSQKKAVESRVDAIGVENLELRLGDEWIPLEPKVSHLSHIYLGTSVFPILTEESWVIENDYMSKSKASAKSLYAKETELNKKEDKSQAQAKRATKIYQFLTPTHWHRDLKKRENEPLLSGNPYVVDPKSLKSKDHLEKTFSAPGVYSSNTTSAVKVEFSKSEKNISDDRSDVVFTQDNYKSSNSFLKAMSYLYNSVSKFIKNVFN